MLRNLYIFGTNRSTGMFLSDTPRTSGTLYYKVGVRPYFVRTRVCVSIDFGSHHTRFTTLVRDLRFLYGSLGQRILDVLEPVRGVGDSQSQRSGHVTLSVSGWSTLSKFLIYSIMDNSRIVSRTVYLSGVIRNRQQH